MLPVYTPATATSTATATATASCVVPVLIPLLPCVSFCLRARVRMNVNLFVCVSVSERERARREEFSVDFSFSLVFLPLPWFSSLTSHFCDWWEPQQLSCIQSAPLFISRTFLFKYRFTWNLKCETANKEQKNQWRSFVRNFLMYRYTS